MTHLTSPHFIRTECAVIGRNLGKMGRFTAHDPVRRAATNHSTRSYHDFNDSFLVRDVIYTSRAYATI